MDQAPDLPQSGGPRNLDLLFELGTMRHVDRTWRQFGGLPLANDAEHSFRVAWIAWLIARKEKADVAKVLQLALLHDVSETRAGDVNYLSRIYVKRDEDRAIRDTFDQTSLADEAGELWAELSAKETLESRVVKDADFIDCDLELSEMAASGYGLQETLGDARQGLRGKLFTETARQIFDEIYAGHNPNRWHLAGPNRLNSGDWRQEPPTPN